MKPEECKRFETRVETVFCGMYANVNQPPDDFHCERCGRNFDSLPNYPADMLTKFPGFGASFVTVHRDGKRSLKLCKIYEEDCGVVSALWVCFDCFKDSE